MIAKGDVLAFSITAATEIKSTESYFVNKEFTKILGSLHPIAAVTVEVYDAGILVDIGG